MMVGTIIMTTLKTQFVEVLDRLYKNKKIPTSDREELKEFTSLVKKQPIKDTDYAKIFVYSLLLSYKFKNEVKKDKLFIKLWQECDERLLPSRKEIKPSRIRE